MTTRKSTLKNILSGCVVRCEHHIDILNAKSFGIEHLTASSLSHLPKKKDCFFLGFSKEVQKEPPKASTQSEILQSRGGFMELEHFSKHFGVFSPRYS